MDRFDLPKNFRDFLDTVLKTGVLDATSLVCLGAEFGHDWRNMGGDIVVTAYCGIHAPKGKVAHSTIVKAWDSLIADNAKSVEPLMVWEDGPAFKALKEGRPLATDELDFDDDDGWDDDDDWDDDAELDFYDDDELSFDDE